MPLISCCGNLIASAIIAVVLVAWYVKWCLNYWNRQNVPTVLTRLNWPKLRFYDNKHYRQMKQLGHKYYGVFAFLSPILVICDVNLVKNFLIKDFSVFSHRGIFYNPKDDPLSNNLFANKGAHWKHMRAKVTPVFTSGKIKSMFEIVLQNSDLLIENVNNFCEKNVPIDIRECLACYTTDIIGTCAFGLDFNSLKNPTSSFREYGKKIFTVGSHPLKRIFCKFYPSLGLFFRMRFLDKDISDFFINLVKETIDYRKKNNYRRNDFIQIMMDLEQEDGTELSLEDIAAQAFIFFIAGFETSSTTLTFALYELGKNPEIQTKLRNEINSTLKKYDNKITYDAMQEMKYVAKVIDETLRKHPVVHSLFRICSENYTIPDTNIVVEKGTTVVIPVYSIQNDPEFYPEPEKFDPERFSEANKQSRLYGTYLPFGDGPRICIGQRFAQMQAKIGLISLIRNFEFDVNKMTKRIVISDQHFIPAPIDPILLDGKKLNS